MNYKVARGKVVHPFGKLLQESKQEMMTAVPVLGIHPKELSVLVHLGCYNEIP